MDGVTATTAAAEVMDRLAAAHGPLVLHQSAGCCEGSAPICVRADELPPGPHDRLLGTIAGVEVHIDSDLYDRWGRPRLLIDVAAGPAEGFSLEGLLGVHFVAGTSDAPGEVRV